jgi:hypothetical protein
MTVLITGCTLDYGPSGDDTSGSSGGDAPSWGECGQPYTATIFEPADGGTYTTTVKTHVRWNEDGIPDRFTSMADHNTHYFIPKGQSEILGDGSEISTYELPAGGTFVFEIGWICNVQQTGGEDAVLARVEFKTQP